VKVNVERVPGESKLRVTFDTEALDIQTSKVRRGRPVSSLATFPQHHRAFRNVNRSPAGCITRRADRPTKT
jgi:hypothetical protein